MGMEFSEFRHKLRLPSWQKADIEAELAAHLQEASADLRVQGRGEAEAQTAALARFGDLNSLAESLQEIHQDWKGGVTVQKRFFRTISLVVIAGVLLLAVILPSLRGLLHTSAYPREYGFFPDEPVTKERVFRKFPRDLYIQLYAAEMNFRKIKEKINRGSEPTEQQLTEAIEKYNPVFALAPDAPAPHLRLAMRLLDPIPLGRPELYQYLRLANFNDDKLPKAVPKKLSTTEQLLLKEAIVQLQIASRNSGENAVPDYLLAYAFFADRQDDRANEALRSALNKQGWNLYDEEMRQAQWKIYQAQGLDPLSKIAGYNSWLYQTQVRLRVLVYFLSGLAGKERQAGKPAQAVFYIAAGLHLSELTLNNAYARVEILEVKYGLPDLGRSFVPEEERRKIKRRYAGRQEREQHFTAEGQKYLKAYLKEQGRTDLMMQYTKDLTLTRELDAQAHTAIKAEISLFKQLWISPWLVHTILLWLQALLAGAALLLVGLLSLLTRYWRERKVAPIWRWWEWLGLMLLLLLPAHYQSFRTYDSLTVPYRYNIWQISEVTSWVMGTSFGIFLFLIMLVAWEKHANQPEEIRQGKLRACLASFRIILLPTVAILLLGTLLISIPSQINFHRFVAEQEGSFQKGEVEYWGIGLPGK
jgi:hypothetical protein